MEENTITQSQVLTEDEEKQLKKTVAVQASVCQSYRQQSWLPQAKLAVFSERCNEILVGVVHNAYHIFLVGLQEKGI